MSLRVMTSRERWMSLAAVVVIVCAGWDFGRVRPRLQQTATLQQQLDEAKKDVAGQRKTLVELTRKEERQEKPAELAARVQALQRTIDTRRTRLATLMQRLIARGDSQQRQALKTESCLPVRRAAGRPRRCTPHCGRSISPT